MGLPNTLVDLEAYNEGLSWLGQIASVKPPTLARKVEAWRGGGMNGEIDLDMGIEKLETEMTLGGPMRDVLRQFGMVSVNGVYLRAVGFFQRQDTAETTAIELIMRGRHQEIDRGEWKVGEPGEFKVKSTLTYYKEIWNGRTEVEIDLLAGVEIIGGIDRAAERRRAVPLF